MDRLKNFFATVKSISVVVQDAIKIDGGLYVDAFAVVMILRLLGPLKGFPAMNVAEAGMWAATITAFSYSNGGPKQS